MDFNYEILIPDRSLDRKKGRKQPYKGKDDYANAAPEPVETREYGSRAEGYDSLIRRLQGRGYLPDDSLYHGRSGRYFNSRNNRDYNNN